MCHRLNIIKFCLNTHTLFQLLQSLNLMDYSLLVGIHDCTLPPDAIEEFEDIDNEYDSGDGYSDQPLSPCNTGR